MPRRVERLLSETRMTRTPSDLLSEIHVYILPQDKWIPFRRLARNTVAEETVSAGFVRVLPNVTLVDLRRELADQLGVDVPENYVFIKCVGRNFTQVKRHQEQVVKVKSFLPPHAEEPEIHIMELSEELLRYAPSLSNFLGSDTELSDSQAPSRLTQHEIFAKTENLESWAESGERKWEESAELLWKETHHSHAQLFEAGAEGDSELLAAGVTNRDHFSVDSGIISHWRSEGNTEEEGYGEEMRHRGDGMSDNRDRRSEGRDEEVERSTESSEERSGRDEGRGERRRSKGRGGRSEGRGGRSQGRGGRSEGRTEKSGSRRTDEGSDESGKGQISLSVTKSESKSYGKLRSRAKRDTVRNGRKEEYSDSDGQINGKAREKIRGRRNEIKGDGKTDRNRGKENRKGKDDSEGDGNCKEEGGKERGERKIISENNVTAEVGYLENGEIIMQRDIAHYEEDTGGLNHGAYENRETNSEKQNGGENEMGARNKSQSDEEHTGREKKGQGEDGEIRVRIMEGDSEYTGTWESRYIEQQCEMDKKEGLNGGVRQNENENEREHEDGERTGEGDPNQGDERDGMIKGEDRIRILEGDSEYAETWESKYIERTMNEQRLKEQQEGDEIKGEDRVRILEGDSEYAETWESKYIERTMNEQRLKEQQEGAKINDDKDQGDEIKGEDRVRILEGDSEYAETWESKYIERTINEQLLNEQQGGAKINDDKDQGDEIKVEDRVRILEGDSEYTETWESKYIERTNNEQKLHQQQRETKISVEKDGNRSEDKSTKRTSETDGKKSKGRKNKTRNGEIYALDKQGGGRSKGEVGGVKREAARVRRRIRKSLVTDSEVYDDQFVSRRNRRTLRSTKFESSQKLTRSVSASRVTDVGSYAKSLEGEFEGPKIKRSASEERLGYDPWLYAPHKWYYARIARPPTGEKDYDFPTSGDLEDSKARLKALEAQKEAILGDERNAEIPKPNVEILSMDGELRGPLASLHEGVISRFQVNSSDVEGTTESPLTSRPDHLTLTYELQVNEDGGRIRKLGRGGGGDGKGAWESEIEDRGSAEVDGEGNGEDGGVNEDDRDLRRRKKGSKLQKGRSYDQLTQEDKVSNRLAQILQEKAEAEAQRQKLFSQAKELHEEIMRVKEKRREQWWKQYSESRKTGSQMEERQTALRSELDSLHRKIIGSIIRRQPLVTGVRDEPSRKANYKISIIRLRHEVEDLRRRVEAMDIKVEAEVRLRNQAEREVKTLRQEVSRKKANMALSQSRASLIRSATNFPPDLLV